MARRSTIFEIEVGEGGLLCGDLLDDNSVILLAYNAHGQMIQLTLSSEQRQFVGEQLVAKEPIRL